MLPAPDPATVAHALLDAARLTMTPEETARLTAAYPELRARADGLYAVSGRDVTPGLGFDPSWESA